MVVAVVVVVVMVVVNGGESSHLRDGVGGCTRKHIDLIAFLKNGEQSQIGFANLEISKVSFYIKELPLTVSLTLRNPRSTLIFTLPSYTSQNLL